MAVKVLDAEGRELRIGACVRLTDAPDLPEPGEVLELLPDDGGALGERVRVRWTDADRTEDLYPVHASGRCPDLELIDSSGEGAG